MSNPRNSHLRREVLRQAALGAVRGLDPRVAVQRPVILGGLVVAALATVLTTLVPTGFAAAATAWIWLVVLALSFGGAMVTAHTRALTVELRGAGEVTARRLRELRHDAPAELVPAARLRRGDLVLVRAGDVVPADGVVVAGVATVKSALSGRSAPLVRESGADRRALDAGALVLSDWLIVDVWSNPGEDFRERLIALGERARRTFDAEPRMLGVLLVGLALIGLAAGATLHPWAALVEGGDPAPLVLVLALLTCSLPASYAGMRPALDVVGFDRLRRINVMASTAEVVRAIESARVLLLEKSSVVVRGNCEAVEFMPMPGVAAEELAEAAFLASLADETPEGRSVVALAERQFGLVPGGVADARFVAWSALTKVSGVDVPGRQIRKGDADAVRAFVRDRSSVDLPDEVRAAVQRVAGAGDVAAVIADGARVLGVVRMKYTMRERIAALRKRGALTVVSSADAPAAAAALAAEAGVDDFLAEATPEAKLALIRRHQAEGRRVAMVGDGNHDGPAMAQADVSVALNAGPLAAREAGSLIDLDGDATKLIGIVEVGDRVRALRRALGAWCLASDLALSLAIVPLVISGTCPEVSALNPLGLHGPASAVLAGLVVHAVALAGVVPLALRGLVGVRAGLAFAAAAVLTLAAVKLLDVGFSSLLGAAA